MINIFITTSFGAIALLICSSYIAALCYFHLLASGKDYGDDQQDNARLYAIALFLAMSLVAYASVSLVALTLQGNNIFDQILT